MADLVRDEAIMLLEFVHGTLDYLGHYLAADAGVGDDALSLAVAAQTAVGQAVYGHGIRLSTGESLNEQNGEYDGTCLEAAALLRDGWSPGDPVEVRTVRP